MCGFTIAVSECVLSNFIDLETTQYLYIYLTTLYSDLSMSSVQVHL